jgi:hypothetical protein
MTVRMQDYAIKDMIALGTEYLDLMLGTVYIKEFN